VEGLRPILPACEGEHGREVEAHRPSVPEGEDLPPVELYEIRDAYFVMDGHHRDSVARYHDVPTVEATVAEFHPKFPAAPVHMTSKSEITA
jgi:hypothetical protein